VRIADTRKTTPGLRILEKYAVRMGGCFNHRFNLSDSIMIKDNHIKAVGSIKEAVEKARRQAPHTMTIEVEVESLEELEEALDSKADIIMLDNMSLDMMKRAVKIADKRAIIEASGNVSHENLLSIANTGVDIISVGALTHSAKSIDISLNIV
jgi:nicotinate-nucleotide pyrophosphorylase (carboxylating)